MKLKNELFVTDHFLKAVTKFNQIETLPVKVSYKFNKATKQIQTQLEDFNDTKNKLIRKYGEESEAGIQVKETSDKFEAFSKEFTELAKEEFEIDFEKLQIPDDIQMSPNDLNILSDLFDLSFLD